MHTGRGHTHPSRVEEVLVTAGWGRRKVIVTLDGTQGTTRDNKGGFFANRVFGYK